MSTATLTPILHRYGDNIYRLALLLANTDAEPEHVLLEFARKAKDLDVRDELGILQTLYQIITKLPKRKPWQRPASWSQNLDQTPALNAISQLTSEQRYLLGLLYLQGLDIPHAAQVLEQEETSVRASRRDALLTLASSIAPDFRADQLLGAGIPFACYDTRAALGLGSDLLHSQPDLRGHLATCAACRSLELHWNDLQNTLEQILRNALRHQQLPQVLYEKMHYVEQSKQQNLRAILMRPSTQAGLLALAIVLTMLYIIWPRTQAAVVRSENLLSEPPNPQALLYLAQQNLYQPIGSQNGVWHGRYRIHWAFASGSQAQLQGDQWYNPRTNQHRIQLVHGQGGGPYEFQLSDGQTHQWYALNSSYAPSVMPLFHQYPESLILLETNPEQQNQSYRLRQQSGAWDLAASYLQQALAAKDIQAWGRHRDRQGNLLSLLSYSGSTLLQPEANPDAKDALPVTILLTIDETNGRLREIRELFGAAGTEQLARTVWRVEREVWLENAAQGQFNILRAWNGIGEFTDSQELSHLQIPLLGTASVSSLNENEAEALASVIGNSPIKAEQYLKIKEPALLINADSYLGIDQDKRIEITYRPVNTDFIALKDPQLILIGTSYVQIQALPNLGYWIQIEPESPMLDSRAIWIGSRGYTRSELMPMIEQIAHTLR